MIYIDDPFFNLPTRCLDCPLKTIFSQYGNIECSLTGNDLSEDIIDYDRRNENCPLKEVKDE